MKKIMIIGQPRCWPVYDNDVTRLLYWKLVYETSDRIIEEKRFRNTPFSKAYKKMCRFQTKYLKQRNENTK